MLLMIENPDREPLAPCTLRIAAGTAGSLDVRQGQLLKITATGAGAVASLYGFARHDRNIFLSVHHTRVFSNSYVLVLGMRLVTNQRRPMMVLGKDTVGTHDLLLPASTTDFLRTQRRDEQTGCVEAVSAEIQKLGLAPPKLPDPINLFMHTKLHQDGRIAPMPNQTHVGDHVIFRVLIDTTVIVSACCTGIEGNDQAAPLVLQGVEDLSEL